MPYVRISECAPLRRSGAGGRRALHMPPDPGGSGYAMGWFRRFENNRSQLEHNGVFSIFYIDLVLLDSGYGLVLLPPSTRLPPTW